MITIQYACQHTAEFTINGDSPLQHAQFEDKTIHAIGLCPSCYKRQVILNKQREAAMLVLVETTLKNFSQARA